VELAVLNTIRIVSATRESAGSFWANTRLGPSLRRLAFDKGVAASVAFENSAGLSAVYNRAIERAGHDDVLVFVHDDISIDDYHLRHRLGDAFRLFDVVGLAGNGAPDRRHVGWYFWQDTGAERLVPYDTSRLSGAVAHATAQGDIVSLYGASPKQCQLLDGLFIAAKVEALRRANVAFDPRFRFHFYDIDFCRSCDRAGLRIGTWPIAVTHASGGAFGSPEWREALGLYREKWPGG
jgi:GT2 family glycosyltransferase